MHTDAIPVAEYEPLAAQFNPTKFDADAWVRLAADAGQKYLVITSRHHDGFSLYDTALSAYKVTNTPFRRDPVAELADGCVRYGIKLGFYVSLMDWHHPAYRFRQRAAWRGRTTWAFSTARCASPEPNTASWRVSGSTATGRGIAIDDSNRYFLPGGLFQYERLYDMIHELQPHAVVQNNRHEQPLPGEDVQGFEQDLPGENWPASTRRRSMASPSRCA